MRPVEAGIVDEPLPAAGRAGLLEVHAHDDEQVVAVPVRCGGEAARVVDRGFGVVHRAWSHHDEQAVVVAAEDRLHLRAGIGDGGFVRGGHGQFAAQLSR